MNLAVCAPIAVLFVEPGCLDLVDRIIRAESVRISVPALVETSLMPARSRRSPGEMACRRRSPSPRIAVVPFGESEWQVAVGAFLRFGRGRHPAALNFGDCLSYAAAAVAGDSLLFVGDDFRKTDITPA